MNSQKKLDDKELVCFKGLLMANSKLVDTAVQFLIEKGFFSEKEFYSRMKQVQAACHKKCQNLMGKIRVWLMR